MTDKSNGLSNTQEVLYQSEFNRADAANKEKNKKNKK
ncbi:hypothetical protein CJ483_09845 [Bacillus sp. PK3_68]|nr:hypothetical protein CJ483_09845 [Bacillus sp. PK3_68]